MKSRFRWIACTAAWAAFSACSAKSLPPGTPPPEYETRSLEPWPPAAGDAGTDAVGTAASEASNQDASIPDASAPDASVAPVDAGAP
jgi:hypothetical protein